ncbi:MAG: phosphatase PAP2 family protein [Planctomycetes bacterium]|nr:phosphatase PAP2 family protein [Planctomycetota bacterium]
MQLTLHNLQRWDLAACGTFNRINHVRVGSAGFALVSRLGDGVFWYALMLALPIVHGAGDWGLSMLLALTGSLSTLVYRWLKGSTRRPRPCDVDGTLRRTVAPLDRFSFPSGHTLHAVGFTVLTVCVHPGWAWILVPFTALVACSRLVLGLHYPSDVAAGASIGALMATAGYLAGRALGIV